MDDNGKETQPVRMIITLMPDGKISVTGPISNKLLSYGLLEMAKTVVTNYKGSNGNIDICSPIIGSGFLRR